MLRIEINGIEIQYVGRPGHRGILRGRRGTTSAFTLCGRRGTWRHLPFCVAGMALMALGCSLCVASLALGDIHLRFAWQASHLLHWAGSGGAYKFVTHRLSHTALSFTTLSHSIFHIPFCHTHTTLSHTHTTLSDTIFHIPLCHTPSFTYHFVTHTHAQLCHAQLWHTHKHTPLVTHNIVTRSFVTHHLSHTTLSHNIFHSHFCRKTTLSHTIFHTQLWHAPSFTHARTQTHRHTHTHNFVSHTHAQTQFCHTQLCQRHFYLLL